jgi:hypothetical protein
MTIGSFKELDIDGEILSLLGLYPDQTDPLIEPADEGTDTTARERLTPYEAMIAPAFTPHPVMHDKEIIRIILGLHGQ